MRHRTHRVDENQDEIVRKIREIGASVLILSQLGDNAPDILVGYRRDNYLMEIKTEAGDLSNEQIHFMNSWNGRKPVVVRTWQEAFKQIGAMK